MSSCVFEQQDQKITRRQRGERKTNVFLISNSRSGLEIKHLLLFLLFLLPLLLLTATMNEWMNEAQLAQFDRINWACLNHFDVALELILDGFRSDSFSNCIVCFVQNSTAASVWWIRPEPSELQAAAGLSACTSSILHGQPAACRAAPQNTKITAVYIWKRG